MERCDIPSVKNVAKIGDTVNDMREGINAGCGLTIGVLSKHTNQVACIYQYHFYNQRGLGNVPVFPSIY